jgi:oxygen-independent coproporphyrinogen-3 oxidase
MRADVKRRYGEERVPRYTSYPAAPMFSGTVSQATYAAWLSSIAPGASTSIYLHVPFCRSMCWYCGCNTSVSRNDAPINDYLAVLKREIELVMDRVSGPLAVSHLHFGGGTPTIVAPGAIADLIRRVTAKAPFSADAEIAIEIDPRTLTPAMAAALGDIGFNRASLGVQSFDPAVQAAINRRQSFEETAEATERLRAAGVERINFDLIYGLPHQTIDSCIDSVRRSLELRPDRFAVFGYAHVPSFKSHQRMIDAATLPDGASRNAQAQAIAETLQEAGYRQIGLDHYALPDDPIVKAQAEGTLRRNFQGYTTDQSDVLIGLGASAIGHLPQGYVQNISAHRAYAERIAAGELATARGYALTPEDRLRAEIIERLMCDFAVDIGEVCAKHAFSPDAVLASAPKLAVLQQDEVVTLRGARLEVNPDARPLVRTVAAAFDTYFQASERPHSPAV